MRCGLDEIRELCGMQPPQPAGELQPGRRDVGDERLDVAPGDELRVLGVVTAEAPGEEAPQARAQAGVDSRHPPHAVLTDELDLTRLDQPRRGDVDQAAIEHVGSQQDLAGTPLELGEIQLGRGHSDGVGTELLDSIDRDEHLPAPDPCLEPDHRGQSAHLVEPHDHVLYASEALAG